MATLLHPKEITVKDGDGKEHQFTIHKFPAVQGREILCKYPLSALPRVGDYDINQETMLKLMAYVTCMPAGATVPVALSNMTLVNNHVPDCEALAQIEMETIKYNCSFFRNGLPSTLRNAIEAKAGPLATKILTQILEQLSKKGAQPSKS